MRQVVVFLIFINFLFAGVVKPEREIEAGGNVIDIVAKENIIIAGTDQGSIEIYNIKDGKKQDEIVFPKIKDFMGDEIGAKVFSVDKITGKDKYMVVLQGHGAYRNMFVIDNKKKTQIIDKTNRYMIKKAKFVDEKRILIALMSNELILFDINKKKEIYRFQLTESQFSDFQLSEDKTTVASGDESGMVHIVNIEKGEIIKTLDGGNVDNVYKVAYRGNRVGTAGQDRRGIVYNVRTGSFDRYDANFLIYACALSPSTKLGAWAFTQENDIAIFNLETQSKLHTLRGQKSTMNTIVFVDEKRLVSGSDDKFIMIWRLP